MYQVRCDRCKRILEDEIDEDYYAVFSSKEEAAYHSSLSCWTNIDDKFYCLDCVEYDKETNTYKPKIESSYSNELQQKALKDSQMEIGVKNSINTSASILAAKIREGGI